MIMDEGKANNSADGINAGTNANIDGNNGNICDITIIYL